MKSLNKGFTLVELIMVVAIIGIIATLAVSKLSGYRNSAKKELALANFGRVNNAIEVFLASGGKLDRLDNLVNAGYSASQPSVETNNFMTGNGGSNKGITDDLRKRFGEYILTKDDVNALSTCLGLKNVYGALYTDSPVSKGEDGSSLDGDVNVANKCSCYAITNLVNSTCAVINPIPASASDYTGAFLIYQACGQDFQFHSGGALYINGTDYSDYSFYASGKGAKSLIGTLPSVGGLLLAFGLGDKATCVGNNQGGLEEAPTSPMVSSEYYSHYILLIRLRKVGQQAVSSTVAEFAGVIDPEGKTHMLANWYKEQK